MIIICTVSRPSEPVNTASSGRLSAQCSMPRGCATQARKDLSELTLAKLKDGLWERGITRNLSQQEGVERALNYLHQHLKLQNPATGKVTGF
jgi:hypothetical protein